MDILTHAAVGGLVTLALRSKKAEQPSLACWLSAGIATAVVPDMDSLIGLLGNPLWGISQHRGITHSILLLPLYAWLLAWLFQRLFKCRYRWQRFFPLTLLVLASHILIDYFTSYGTQLLTPWSDTRFSLPLLFIVDPPFTLMILGLVVAALLVRPATARLAQVGLLGVACYVALAWDYRQQARDIIHAMYPDQEEQLYALPQPLSAKNWKLIRATADGYEISQVQLGRRHLPLLEENADFLQRLDARFQPLDTMLWQRFFSPEVDDFSRAAWQEGMPPLLKHFLHFPVLHYTEVQSPQRVKTMECAWVADLRFMQGDVASAFVFGSCLNPDAKQWEVYRLRDHQAQLVHTAGLSQLGEALLRRVTEVPELVDK